MTPTTFHNLPIRTMYRILSGVERTNPLPRSHYLIRQGQTCRTKRVHYTIRSSRLTHPIKCFMLDIQLNQTPNQRQPQQSSPTNITRCQLGLAQTAPQPVTGALLSQTHTASADWHPPHLYRRLGLQEAHRLLQKHRLVPI